jgi:hypothetical protein
VRYDVSNTAGHSDRASLVLVCLGSLAHWDHGFESHVLIFYEGDRVMWRIFGPNREEVTGGWRRLHDEELHNLNVSQKNF